jgi:cyclophilin family peptidyl-prolyl cis-trans isomerase
MSVTVRTLLCPPRSPAKFQQLNTTHGPVKLEIFCEAVPKASENFLALCASGQYDGTAVHRIIKDFIMQTGAPAGDTKAKVGARSPHNPFCEHI